MKPLPYAETAERIKRASEPIRAEAWDTERARRELDLPGAGCGVVSVHQNGRDDDGTAFVSIELYGLSCEQAEAILLAATLPAAFQWNQPRRVTYDIPELTPGGRRYVR